MLALILAGGEGSRLQMGEKPLVLVCGRPMIERVVGAFAATGCDVVVVTSPRTPYTRNWCRVNGIDQYPAAGRGYVEDIVEAAGSLDADGPILTSVSDIPCITPGIVGRILDAHAGTGMPALSTWVPASLCNGSALRCSYQEMVHGVPACPAGVNILDGGRIDQEQPEFRLLIEEPGLGFNVNTPQDLARAERALCPDTNGLNG
ncbi:NTP transferase domain-containing protein [Methanofollis fontis]|uniref:5-deoxyadenosylcobinamide phosphate nucleotidyltransferase n=1 Tax=Methanofollis fontis TaxID=2052832 RepID=A0A483CTH0_9EURY|nr:NTP transferase domain-containing protein [Methanofollis fontis]TAJ44663.1 5-deoxyadenosylcobinamide phosphate nucleotidyltransferase [Methanofollis fontis]